MLVGQADEKGEVVLEENTESQNDWKSKFVQNTEYQRYGDQMVSIIDYAIIDNSGNYNSTLIKNEEFNLLLNLYNNVFYKRIDCNEQTHRVNKLPIDHIFVSKKYKVKSIKVLNTGFSDHKAIIVDIEL